jgi:hypothetical protein
MLIEEAFSVDAPRAEVVRFLLDVPRMGACVPGVEDLHRVDDARYEATLVVRVGPIQARFRGDVSIDATGAPDTIVASASGRDSTTGSVAQVRFFADLVESEDGSTEIRSASDVTIRGRLGQFGSGVVASTAREMVKTFAQCAGQEIGGVAPSASRSSNTQGIAPVVARGVLSWLREIWSRIFRRRGQVRSRDE